jgi:predicted neuraminidase
MKLSARRLLLAGIALTAVVLIDLAQRSAPPATARAAIPTWLQQTGKPAWHRVGVGSIPMPAATPSAHASNLLVMPPEASSALTAFWFAGAREGAPDVQIAASQFDRTSQQWVAARFVLKREVQAEQLGYGIRRFGNPVSWRDASGRIHLFVVATGLGGWAAGRVLHTVQTSVADRLEMMEFTPLRVLPLSWLWNISHLVRGAPLPLHDGGMLLPAYFEMGVKYPVALRFDRKGEFVGMERMSQRSYLLQPTIVTTSPTDWVALLRDTRPDGRVGVVRSQDSGAHWADAESLQLVNPDAAVAAVTLAPGQHVLVHNSSPHSRSALDLSVSGDGLAWTRLAPLESGTDADEYSYPALAWADHSLWISYTDHRRQIAWQRFSPFAADAAADGAKP